VVVLSTGCWNCCLGWQRDLAVRAGRPFLSKA
jgi:hypothetical protein